MGNSTVANGFNMDGVADPLKPVSDYTHTMIIKQRSSPAGGFSNSHKNMDSINDSQNKFKLNS